VVDSRFWTEGPIRLRRALEQRKAEIDSLVERIQGAADPDERRRLQLELRRLVEAHQRPVADIDDSLFFSR
jgi:hypothetical protein